MFAGCVYNSERLAAAHAFDRPPVHQQLLRSAVLDRRADRALDVGAGACLPPQRWRRWLGR
jgi:hypothetical protein